MQSLKKQILQNVKVISCHIAFWSLKQKEDRRQQAVMGTLCTPRIGVCFLLGQTKGKSTHGEHCHLKLHPPQTLAINSNACCTSSVFTSVVPCSPLSPAATKHKQLRTSSTLPAATARPPRCPDGTGGQGSSPAPPHCLNRRQNPPRGTGKGQNKAKPQAVMIFQ